MGRAGLLAFIVLLPAAQPAHAAALDGAAPIVTLGPAVCRLADDDRDRPAAVPDYSKIAVVWSALAFAPIALVYGASTAAAAFVANVGGALHGVDFFWTAQNLWSQTLIVAAPVLTLGHLE